MEGKTTATRVGGKIDVTALAEEEDQRQHRLRLAPRTLRQLRQWRRSEVGVDKVQVMRRRHADQRNGHLFETCSVHVEIGIDAALGVEAVIFRQSDRQSRGNGLLQLLEQTAEKEREIVHQLERGNSRGRARRHFPLQLTHQFLCETTPAGIR